MSGPKSRSELHEALRVKPGQRVHVERIDPSNSHGYTRAGALTETERHLATMADLQDKFWAESKRSILVVLQGIDAAGKDGTINKVMEAFNPQGCVVSSFKVPTPEELGHDFLWRIHKRTPGRGEIGIFNRSHYEDVLVVRVHDIVPKSVWSKRYDQINMFEKTLADAGTTIVKFFLSIDRDEQRARFQARYDDPTRRWKFSLGDLQERKLWDDYQLAFDDAISKTSTAWAPWYVIPANKKWFRNLAVSSVLAEIMTRMKPRYPEPADLPPDLVIE
jgi:PPK2 family polyphosphate:nucleotide phosphotransferase